eukprot:sb/3473055/
MSIDPTVNSPISGRHQSSQTSLIPAKRTRGALLDDTPDELGELVCQIENGGSVDPWAITAALIYKVPEVKSSKSNPDLPGPDLLEPRLYLFQFRKFTVQWDPDLGAPDLVDKSLSPEGVPKSGSDCSIYNLQCMGPRQLEQLLSDYTYTISNNIRPS